jgi:fido (protein-threonine AMPylation protein)
MTRVNSTNVLDEGLRIGEIGRRMNSKVRLVEIGVYRKLTWVFNLAYFQSALHRPLLAPIYRWPGLEDRVGSDTDYNYRYTVRTRIRLSLQLGLA